LYGRFNTFYFSVLQASPVKLTDHLRFVGCGLGTFYRLDMIMYNGN